MLKNDTKALKTCVLKAFLLLVALPCAVEAQNIPFSDILKTALEDIRVVHNRQNTEAIRGLRFRVPLIRRAEARIGFNGSTLGDTLFGTIRNEDFYGIVIGPNSLRERRRQADFQAAVVAQSEVERGVVLAAAVSERYQAYAAWYFAWKLRTEQEKLSQWLQKQADLWRIRIEQGVPVKASDILQNERDQYNLLLQIQENKNTEMLQLQRLRQYADWPPNQLPDTLGITTSTTIEQQLSALKSAPVYTPLTALREARWQVAKADQAMEDAQNRQIFNFVQIGYDDPVLAVVRPNRRRTFNNFSFRVAVEMPIPGNNNPQRAKAAIDALEARSDRDITQQLSERSAALQVTELENTLSARQACSLQIEKSLTRRLLEDPTFLQQMTPAEWIEGQILMQRRALQCLETEQQMLLAYLRLLELKGWLAREPLQNFLTIR